MHDENAVDEAVSVLERGGLIIFPTETLYGLGCDARDEAAVRRLFDAKGRASSGDAFKPPPILVRDLEMARDYAQISPLAQGFIAQHWPGALTLVLPARERDAIPGVLCGFEGGVRTLGVRASAHPIAQKLLEKFNAPVVATSANVSGATGHSAAPRRLKDVAPELLAHVEAALDGGEVGGIASTVLDCVSAPPRVLRQGAVTLQLG